VLVRYRLVANQHGWRHYYAYGVVRRGLD